MPSQKVATRMTIEEVYAEYCEKGRKQIDDITVAEIQDYLGELYYIDNREYSYTESFLKMFYLIFGQAYSRNYMEVDSYNKLCINKDIKIHMPKL